MKFKIKNKDKKFKYGFIGMNYYADKKHIHANSNLKKNEIGVYSKLSKSVRAKTIKHEKIEASLMSKGKSYKTAHKFALKHEGDRARLKTILKRKK